MLDSRSNYEKKVAKALEACRTLTQALINPHTQPLEREAGLLLGEALLIQIEALNIFNDPDVQRFINVWESSRQPIRVRRFPQDFLTQ